MKKMTNTERIKSVVKSTLQMLFILSIFSLFFIADKLLGFIDDPINWGAYLYIALYAIIVSVVFGFLDKPKLENKILIFLLILSLLIWVIPNQFSTHFGYVFIGVSFGRKLLIWVDLGLKNFKSKINKVKKNPPQ
jgi:hypothetical protein